MKFLSVCLGAAIILAAHLASGQIPGPPKEPEIDPAAENALRTVGPDERLDAGSIYWEFAKSMEHGAILFPSRSPALMFAVQFEAFPKWSSNRVGGAITVNVLASSRFERGPPSPSYHLDEFFRVIPQALLERLEKTWDRALTTARVDGDQKSGYMMDGVVYEFRGGRYTLHPYVAAADSPHAGLSGSMGALTDVLIDYCVSDDKGHFRDVKDIEDALKAVEESLKSQPPAASVKAPLEPPKIKP
jgi:hypothetical protein